MKNFLIKFIMVQSVFVAIIVSIITIQSYNPNQIMLNQKKMDSTAIDILDRINPVSMKEDFEYAGLIVATSSRYFATVPATDGKKHSATTPAWKASIYAGIPLAMYHTHAADSPDHDDCRFSVQDTSGRQLVQYLATPCGTILKFNPKDRMVYTYDRALEAWEPVFSPDTSK